MPQPKLHWSAYLWPGLAQVWLRGSWVGLTLAVGFTAILNLLVASALVWDEWLPTEARWVGVAGLAAIWAAALIDGRAEWRRLLAEWSADDAGQELPDARSDQWFQEAQVAYLAGDWVSTEQTLVRLLRQDARDAEARLMLATLWRHEGRLDAAREQLDQLDRLETAAPWAYEITRERERICANCVETIRQEPAGDSPAVTTDATREGGAITATCGTRIEATNRRMAA